MKMHAEASVVVPKAPAEVFDFSTAIDSFQKVLKRFGPIPGIIGQENEGGAPTQTGTRRRVFMSDDTVVEEEVLAFERPRVHHYRWMNKPAFPFSLLVATGEAEWSFSAEGPGTKVVWHYQLGLTSPLAYPAMLIVRALFRRWMQQGLDGIRAALAA